MTIACVRRALSPRLGRGGCGSHLSTRPGRRTPIVVRALICAIAILLTHSTAGQSLPVTVPGSDRSVPPQYWGLHIHRAGSQSVWPAAGFGSWRLWDAGVAVRHRFGDYDASPLGPDSPRTILLGQAA